MITGAVFTLCTMTPVGSYYLPQSMVIKTAQANPTKTGETASNKPAVENKPVVATKQAEGSKVKPALTVSVKKPFYKDLPARAEVNGNVAAWQEASIGSELNGLRIESVLVDVGSVVTKGQVLATLNTQTIRAEYNQAKAAVAEAQANLMQAKETAVRARTLDQTGAISAQQMSQYFTAEVTARARVESAKAALSAQSIRLEQTKIVAPDSGIVSSRTAAAGSLVGGELFKVILQEKLQWKAQISADQIDLVKVGQQVELVTKLGETLKATVSDISPVINEKTRQGTLLVNLDKEVHQHKIKAGMFLNGSILMENNKLSLIDQQAVILRDGFNYVFVLNADNRVVQTKVEVGMRVGNYIEIKTKNDSAMSHEEKVKIALGLQEGPVKTNKGNVTSNISMEDRIVISGATFLKDQDVVNVAEGK